MMFVSVKVCWKQEQNREIFNFADNFLCTFQVEVLRLCSSCKYHMLLILLLIDKIMSKQLNI